MQGKHTSSPVSKKFLSWPRDGITVTSAQHFNVLQNELQPAVCTKRRGGLTQGVLWLLENACCHVGAHTVTTLHTELGSF
jgi:hypothetical protein